MDYDQRKPLIGRWGILFFFCLGVCAQDTTPFLNFTPSKEYRQALRAIETTEGTPLDKINAKIKLSSKHKNQEDLIQALSAKIELEGENAQLRYLLGGANGIKAIQTAKLFALPYVRAMLHNFHRAVAIDSTYTPALEAIVEALCQVPPILGGSLSEATAYADILYQQSTIEGLFAYGLIAETKKNKENVYYQTAFEQMETMHLCSTDLTAFFANKSMNFPYKVAEISIRYNLYPALGHCAIDYFIANRTSNYNLPIEWLYYRKGQLLVQLGQPKEAMTWMTKALDHNPNFSLVKNYIKTIEK